jgi:hypothetical protein
MIRQYLSQETGRASTRPQTVMAPAAKSDAAHASSVEPVVHTSSMIRILRLKSAPVANAGLQTKAPATF